MGGTMVQERASLHEKAVQKVARGEVAFPPTPKVRGRQNRSGKVTHLQVNSEVWRTATQLLDDHSNHYTRIEIVSAEEVWLR